MELKTPVIAWTRSLLAPVLYWHLSSGLHPERLQLQLSSLIKSHEIRGVWWRWERTSALPLCTPRSCCDVLGFRSHTSDTILSGGSFERNSSATSNRARRSSMMKTSLRPQSAGASHPGDPWVQRREARQRRHRRFADGSTPQADLQRTHRRGSLGAYLPGSGQDLSEALAGGNDTGRRRRHSDRANDLESRRRNRRCIAEAGLPEQYQFGMGGVGKAPDSGRQSGCPRSAR